MKESDIFKACSTLKEGGIILYPTDTVWGIGCDATNKEAVKKIFLLKERDTEKALIVLVSGFDMLSEYVSDIPEYAKELISKTSEPLTVIYPAAHGLPNNLIAADESVGIRIVNDDFCRTIIECFGKPIVSTSANISGEQTPAIFNEVKEEIKNKVDYIVEYNRDCLRRNNPSKVIRIKPDSSIEVIRG